MGLVKRIEIRWRDLDGFAHVNNSVYFTYGEEVRDEFFTGLLGHDVVNFMVVRNCQVDYRSGLTQADDFADVHVEITAIGRSSVTTAERIVSAADGRVAAESATVTVHTNADRAAAEAWDDASRAKLEAERGR
jgi:acyl-CoA thioester hydrolase